MGLGIRREPAQHLVIWMDERRTMITKESLKKQLDMLHEEGGALVVAMGILGANAGYLFGIRVPTK